MTQHGSAVGPVAACPVTGGGASARTTAPVPWRGRGLKSDTLWVMTVVQLESIAPPLDRPGIGLLAVRLLTVAEAMGLLPRDKPIRRLDQAVLEDLAQRATAAAGIGREALADLRDAHRRPDRMAPALRRLYEALERSPSPSTEWRSLVATLGLELLSQLLGLSTSSLRRYAAGTRRTPDDVADRLHFIVLVMTDLTGSLNDFGVRRWFMRPRVALDGKSPAQLLRGKWTPDGAGPARVRELARSLTAPLGT